MISRVIQTKRILPGSCSLKQLLDEALDAIEPGSVLAITSKVVSLCENTVVPIEGTDKQELIRREAEYYMPDAQNKYGINLTITHGTLIPNSGIDESNVGDVLAVWPRDPQASANMVRQYLVERFGHKDVGVIITDSTCRPLRWGVSGVAMAYSGFEPLHSYIGQEDLFGRPFKVSQADIAGGLAATAVLVMGEGAESTPLAVLSDLPFVRFTDRDPTKEELAALALTPEEDLFAPLLTAVKWLPGGKAPRG